MTTNQPTPRAPTPQPDAPRPPELEALADSAGGPAPAGHHPQLSSTDLYLFAEGTHCQLHERLGGQLTRDGARFAVWAPNAEGVSVIGEFNGWDGEAARLQPVGSSGIWAGFVAGAARGQLYKYRVFRRGEHGGAFVDKLDPVGLLHETPPNTASILWRDDYRWGDGEWLRARAERQRLGRPVSVYEVHLGSWMRVPEEGARALGYRELAQALTEHCLRLGFTHVELLPISEHPFYGSWGYQTTGYFAPTHRLGKPEDLMYLIDTLHQAGVGVILDWVPAHFPEDEFALARYDGTCLYEHEDPRRGRHPDWGTLIFNYGRNEVRSFLLSSALMWIERFHVDGLRVDAVASMLYLDYSRAEGEWLPNRFGGRENLEAIEFLRQLNDAVHARAPGVLTIAEESTAWPQVTDATESGGLGFDLKWDMGWMHDTLRYLARDPIHRQHHHDELTFRQLYAYKERYVLPLSHDEVVHGKGSLVGKMHGDLEGDPWRKFAHLRLLLVYQFTMPGNKLLFMGGELGQVAEWDHDRSLDWHLREQGPYHAGVEALVAQLNALYVGEPALHEGDFVHEGFRWLVVDDAARSVYAYLRAPLTEAGGPPLLVALNFTPLPRLGYELRVEALADALGGVAPTAWRELLSSDEERFGGSGVCNGARLELADEVLRVDVPPLGAVILRPLAE